MSGLLEKKKFDEIDLNDHFFESLKGDYSGFEQWFLKKRDEEAYISFDQGMVQGFLYLKFETGPATDIEPPIDGASLMKVGTFKINPHGTRLGERFIKKALDYALSGKADKCYVTIFERHRALVQLFEKYGFSHYGWKHSVDGSELVLVKDLKVLSGEILADYPMVQTQGRSKYLLSIYPEYHSNMFPDSILHNESVDILEDVSYTNSIHKIYVTRMGVSQAVPGDIFIMYRTRTEGQSAEYTSVATSVCVVEEIRSQTEFDNFEKFFAYSTTYSIFDRDNLKYWYDRGGCYTVKMTYNAALSKRLIRQKLIHGIGISRDTYWGFIRLTDEQFGRIIKEGGVLEGIVID